MGPATLTVTLIVGLLIVFGALMLRVRKGQPRRVCPDAACAHKNRPRAKYCSRCGQALRESETNSMNGE